jgi:hypothetical protein
MSMVRHGMRGRLYTAIQEATATGQRVVVRGGRAASEAGAPPLVFDIEVQPVPGSRDALMLICFLDQPKPQNVADSAVPAENGGRIAELEQELELAHADLTIALHNLELSSDEQTAINEEALSVNEEYQSANEELLTSKEELQPTAGIPGAPTHLGDRPAEHPLQHRRGDAVSRQRVEDQVLHPGRPGAVQYPARRCRASPGRSQRARRR